METNKTYGRLFEGKKNRSSGLSRGNKADYMMFIAFNFIELNSDKSFNGSIKYEVDFLESPKQIVSSFIFQPNKRESEERNHQDLEGTGEKFFFSSDKMPSLEEHPTLNPLIFKLLMRTLSLELPQLILAKSTT